MTARPVPSSSMPFNKTVFSLLSVESQKDLMQLHSSGRPRFYDKDDVAQKAAITFADSDQIERALAVSLYINNASLQSFTLLHIAKRLASQKQPDQALAVYHASSFIDSHCLTKIARTFAKLGKTNESLNCLQQVKNDLLVCCALKKIIPQITDLTHIAKCNDMASCMNDETYRASTQNEISKKLSDFQQLRESLRIISQMSEGRPGYKAKALAHLASRLPDLEMAEEVLSLIMALPSDASYKDEALGNISVIFARHGQVEKALGILRLIDARISMENALVEIIKVVPDVTDIDKIVAFGCENDRIMSAIVRRYARTGVEYLERALSLVHSKYSQSSMDKRVYAVAWIIEGLPDAMRFDQVRAFADSLGISWEDWTIRRALVSKHAEWDEIPNALQMIEENDPYWKKNDMVLCICRSLEARGKEEEAQKLKEQWLV